MSFDVCNQPHRQILPGTPGSSQFPRLIKNAVHLEYDVFEGGSKSFEIDKDFYDKNIAKHCRPVGSKEKSDISILYVQ